MIEMKAIAALLLGLMLIPVALLQSSNAETEQYAPESQSDRILKITVLNTKTELSRVIEIQGPYLFENSFQIDVSDNRLHKIERAFDKTTFLFEYEKETFEGKTYPWIITIELAVPAGHQIKVSFI